MKRLAAAFALIAALAALGVSARAFLERAPRLRAGLDVAHVELGEALRLAAHPASVNPSYRLPWAAVLEADAYLRLSPRALTAWAAGLWLLALLLVFALGRELGGTAGGAAAAALWAPVFARLPHGPGTLKQTWLTVLGLLAAALWVRRAKKDSDRASLLAGAGLGLTLLTRGTFVFLPLLSVLLERRRRAGLLAGAALAFLLPWTAMNLASHGRFVPLEDGAMNMNVVTGALGTVFCAHGDYAAFMGDGAGSPLAWAAKTVAAEPARYLRGVAGRVARVLELQPFLFLLAGLALFSRRRDPGVRALGLFAAYFIAVNVAMSIEDNYFEPLWPLLAARPSRPRPQRRAAARAARAGRARPPARLHRRRAAAQRAGLRRGPVPRAHQGRRGRARRLRAARRARSPRRWPTRAAAWAAKTPRARWRRSAPRRRSKACRAARSCSPGPWPKAGVRDCSSTSRPRAATRRPPTATRRAKPRPCIAPWPTSAKAGGPRR